MPSEPSCTGLPVSHPKYGDEPLAGSLVALPGVQDVVIRIHAEGHLLNVRVPSYLAVYGYSAHFYG